MIVGAVVVVGLAVAETSVRRPVAVVEGASAAVDAVWARGRATLIVCPT